MHTQATIKSIYVPAFWTLVFAGLFVFLQITPIRMGVNANRLIPVIGQVETISRNSCDRTLTKVSEAYGTANTLTKTISTAQRIELEGSVPLVGLGMSFSPFEALVAGHDSLGRVSEALYAILGLTIVEKLSIGMVSWVCFKVCLPLALLLGLLHIFTMGRLPWAKPAGLFLTQVALTAWLFFPCTALVTTHVERAYLNGEYERILQEVEQDKAQMAILQTTLDSAQDKSGKESSMWERSKDQLSQTTEKIKAALNLIGPTLTRMVESADRATDKLFHLVTLLAMTIVVIPLVILFLLYRLMGILCADYSSVSRGGTLFSQIMEIIRHCVQVVRGAWTISRDCASFVWRLVTREKNDR